MKYLKYFILQLSFLFINSQNQDIYLLRDFFSLGDILLRIRCKRSLYDMSYLSNIVISQGVEFDTDMNGMNYTSCKFNSTKANYFETNIPYHNQNKSAVLYFWVYIDKFQNESTLLHFDFFENLKKKHFKMFFINNNSTNFISIEYNDGQKLNSNKTEINSKYLNTWIFIQTFFYGESISVYINNEKDKIVSLNVLKRYISFDNLDLSIGKSSSQNENYFNGKIKELTLFLIPSEDSNSIKIDSLVEILYEKMKCEFNEILLNNGTCSYCGNYLKGCEFCSMTSPDKNEPDVCFQCGQGFYWNVKTLKCECNMLHCKECNSNGCLECEDTYHVDDKKNCEKNDCTRCQGDKCYECIKDYTLYGNSCKVPYRAFLGIIIVYAIVVVIIWVILLTAVRPRLIK